MSCLPHFASTFIPSPPLPCTKPISQIYTTAFFHSQFYSMFDMAQWTRFDDKLFEQALVVVPENSPNRWQMIADIVPGKSPLDVRNHYETLIHDLAEIDSGRIELPSYADDSLVDISGWDSETQISFASKTKHGGDAERKKGTPWSEEEHKLFLLGLKKYGKGDWRSISRNVVITRTPTQVASHAQKYFLRQSSVRKERKRTSIHDITSVESSTVPPPLDQNWTSQSSHPMGGSMGYQTLGFQM